MNLFVLNQDLERIGIIENYKSLIWANRYRAVGDCELYLPATVEAFELLRMGRFLIRSDEQISQSSPEWPGIPMICQIKQIELDTDVENGDFLIVRGYDAKRLLDQRIVWGTMIPDRNAEEFILYVVNRSIGLGADIDRQLLNSDGVNIFRNGAANDFTEAVTGQISYKNVGEFIREYCNLYGWGYRVYFHFFENTNHLTFSLYKGKDKTSEVVFAEEYENLSKSVYSVSDLNVGNVALVGGQGEGSARERQTSGAASSFDRVEIFVDAKDISKTITFENLQTTFPGGTVSGTVYVMPEYSALIYDDEQLAEMQIEYPGGVVVEIDGNRYYKMQNAIIADLPNSSPQSNDNVTLRDVIYMIFLKSRGYEKIAERGRVTSFNGTIEPMSTFKFRKDYNLGDWVTVRNSYGVSIGAQIVEVVEVFDENGYSVEPKFQYKTEE